MFLLIPMSCFQLQAEENLVFHLKNGEKTVIALDKKPVITFEKDNMVVTSEDSQYSVPMKNIASYDFSEATEVEQVLEKTGKPVFSNGHVVFSKLKVGSRVFVYAIDGKQLQCYTADSSGYVDVDLTTLSKGIYILKSPGTNIKITN